ncbi:MAG: hypothetical protein V7L01_33085 [Nostoc sp.]|uniref:hypothetical protein n=1 Tax=Nostoc sp. TaxID=1180 RepID=UPI002FF50962
MDKLQNFFGKIASSLPTTSDSEPFIVTENSLPCPQQLISTAKLVVKKGVHQYGSWYQIDQLWFFAHKQTYRQLSLLILACIFSPHIGELELLLTHQQSDIKKIIVESQNLDIDTLTGGFYTKPFAFKYWPEVQSCLHPLHNLQVPDWDLPELLLTDEGDCCTTEEDWKNRSVIRGFGTPSGATHFAELLLNIGLPETENQEFYLESYVGNRSLAPGSAEARLWLPGGNYWDDSLFEESG